MNDTIVIPTDLDHTAGCVDEQDCWIHCAHKNGPGSAARLVSDTDSSGEELTVCDGCSTRMDPGPDDIVIMVRMEQEGLYERCIVR